MKAATEENSRGLAGGVGGLSLCVQLWEVPSQVLVLGDDIRQL